MKAEFVYGGKGQHKKVLIEERGHKCQCCGLSAWLGNNPIPLEMDHIDGDRKNNVKENLMLLCPNCHAFTPTYKGKNRNKSTERVTDEMIREGLDMGKSVKQILEEHNLTPAAGNYERVYEIKYRYL